MGNKSVATTISKDEFDPEKCQKKIFAPLPAILLEGLLAHQVVKNEDVIII